MIERANYLDVRAFIEYRERVLQRDKNTIRDTWLLIKKLLVWADDTPFPKAATIKNPYPVFLLTAREADKDKPLAPTVVDKACMYARIFYEWAKNEYPNRYKGVSQSWIETILPRRSLGEQSVYKKRITWELSDIEKIASLQVDRLADKRDQAAICFMYLSGMRRTAFVTLPILCVDISGRRVEQLPEKGVLTKYRKAAITSLLPIPSLLSVVGEWDSLVRKSLPGTSLWYPRLAPGGDAFDLETPAYKAVGGRTQALVDGIHRLCALADTPYKSPHKLRHGHAVWGLKHSKTIEQMKAVSQNLMHKNLGITDGIYAVLTSDDVANSLLSLGYEPDKAKTDMPANAETLTMLQEILTRLKEKG